MGRLTIPATRIPLRLTLDGAPLTRTRGGVVLSAGRHTLRGESEEHFLVVETTADVPADGAATAGTRSGGVALEERHDRSEHRVVQRIVLGGDDVDVRIALDDHHLVAARHVAEGRRDRVVDE